MLIDRHAEATYGFDISTSLNEAQNKKLLQVCTYLLTCIHTCVTCLCVFFHKLILCRDWRSSVHPKWFRPQNPWRKSLDVQEEKYVIYTHTHIHTHTHTHTHTHACIYTRTMLEVFLNLLISHSWSSCMHYRWWMSDARHWRFSGYLLWCFVYYWFNHRLAWNCSKSRWLYWHVQMI